MGLNTPLMNFKRGRNDSFRYQGGCSGGAYDGGSPSVGPSDHSALGGSQAVGQENENKTVIGQNKEWSTGG